MQESGKLNSERKNPVSMIVPSVHTYLLSAQYGTREGLR